MKNTKFRLYIFKSNKHIYANLIDDRKKKIITSSSTISKDTKQESKSIKNCSTAKIVGKNIGIKIKKLGITEITFDRGKNIYHGQVKALAEGTREQGIIF
uniref:Large ribosomal subunit protein uL18c n=1 Tax=Polysiphonia sertularioides TaxID=945028 RepID=A0A1Z1M991_9FLOR|nr:ribosomal protein L18 [Polysiphonia sertularioides]ARW62540.1 ribosomal protein L18 [Polysiphonia sertularioides]